MVEVEVEERDLRDAGRASSKGNQLKWERNHIWYKADYTGYEGLAEYLKVLPKDIYDSLPH